MNKFEKVSYEQFKKDYLNLFPREDWNDEDENWLKGIYDNIKLPSRAEHLSAGYDFFTPISLRLLPQTTITIPTGIKVVLDSDKWLAIVPRSGLGFKYSLGLSNTIGVIDSSYSLADNEGHIMAKLSNNNYEEKELTLTEGKAFMQGIIMSYYTTEDDKDTVGKEKRIGGFGSTNR